MSANCRKQIFIRRDAIDAVSNNIVSTCIMHEKYHIHRPGQGNLCVTNVGVVGELMLLLFNLPGIFRAIFS